MRLGVDGELGPQRLRDSSAAQELRCLLDTQPSEPRAWLERLQVAVADTFGPRPDLLNTALHALELAALQLGAQEAAKRDAALAQLDALLFALSLARSIPVAPRP